jgi:NADH-quinone oxidoreductase subunit C
MTKDELTAYIKDKYTGQIEIIENKQAEPYFLVKADDLVSFARFIHDDPALQMTFMMNLAAVDTGTQYEAIYNICSYQLKHRLFFKVILDHENPQIDTVMPVWKAANWYEREIWELFGITVKNHPNLTRFLLTDDWDEGFPMRKGWTGTDFIVMPERK